MHEVDHTLDSLLRRPEQAYLGGFGCSHRVRARARVNQSAWRVIKAGWSDRAPWVGCRRCAQPQL